MGILDDLVKNGYQCTGTIFSDPNQNMYTYHYEEGAFALAIPRFIGDDIMNKAAVNSGIDYLENFEATKVLFERGQAVGVRGIYNGVVVELEADLVVLADGGHSMLARQCGFFEENPDYVFYGIRGYFEGIRGLSDVIEFHYPHEMFMPAGYTWIFPLGKTKGNVGVFITETALNNTGMTIEELLWWWRDTTEIGGLRLGEATQIGDIKGWRLPSGKHQPIHGAGVLAVGDCANMIEPLFGGGYPHAVTAGVCAAKVAREAVDANDFSKEFLGKYVEYVNEALGSGYAIQELLRKQVFGTTKDIQELIDFSIEKFEGKRLSGGDAMAIFLKERRDFKGATKSAYSK